MKLCFANPTSWGNAGSIRPSNEDRGQNRKQCARGRIKYMLSVFAVMALMLCIGAAAFADTITLPDALRTIEAEAFMNDTSLETVVIPSTVTSIGSKAFAGSSATAVFISSSEITIEGDAFDQTATLYVSSDAAYNAAYGRFTYRDLRNTNTLTMTPHSDENDHIINGTRNDKAYMDFTATVANGIDINTTEIQVLVSLDGNFEGTHGRDWWETPSRPYSPETQEYRLAPSLTAYLKGILLDSSGNQLAESGVVEITTQDKNSADSPYNWSDENEANHHKLVLNNGTVTADLIGPPYFWFETTGNGVYQFVTSGVASISITNQDGKFICSANESGINSPYAGTEGSNVSSFSIPVDDGTSSLYLEVRKANNYASLTVTKEGAVIPTNTLTMTRHSDENDNIINGTRNDKAYMDFTATVANGIDINTTEIQVLVSLDGNFEGTHGRDWWETPSRPYSPETQEYRLAPSLTAYLKGILLDSSGNQLAESGVVEITTQDKNSADSPYNWSDENEANHHKLVLNNGTVTADLIGPPYFWFETTGNGVYQFVTSGVASISITNQDGKFICSANESGINSPYAGTEGSNVSSFSIPVDDGTSSLYLEVRKANNNASLTITKRS